MSNKNQNNNSQDWNRKRTIYKQFPLISLKYICKYILLRKETIRELFSSSCRTSSFEKWKHEGSRARCTYSRWLYHVGKGESSLFSLAPSHCKSNEPANRGQRRQAPTRCHDLTNHLRIQPSCTTDPSGSPSSLASPT